MISGLVTQADVAGALSLDCGVVIVGSGAGGATVAAELAEAGVDVVLLEEGGYHPTESFTAGTGRALRTLYRDGGGGMAIGRPSVLYAEGRPTAIPPPASRYRVRSARPVLVVNDSVGW